MEAGHAQSGLHARPRGDVGRIGSSATSAVGRALLGGRAPSRPGSRDPPISPSRTVASPQRLGQGIDSVGEKRPHRQREDSASRKLDMPPVDVGAPDSLTELLGLHSRPSSYGSRISASHSVSSPSSNARSALSSACRPGSRDFGLLGETKPPRAPGHGVGMTGTIITNGQVGITTSVSGGVGGAGSPQFGSFSESRRQSRPCSHPRESPHGSYQSTSGRHSSVGAFPVSAPSGQNGTILQETGRPITPRNPTSPSNNVSGTSDFSSRSRPAALPIVSNRQEPRRLGVGIASSASQSEKVSPVFPTAALTSGASRAVSSSASPWGSHVSPSTVSVVSVAQDANEDFRTYMEDGYHIVDPVFQRGSRGKEENWGFFGVYDGHGSRKEVDYVEAKLHDVVLAELRSLPLGKDIHVAVRLALITSFKKIDDQLAMLGAWESGCTCTVMLLQRHDRGLVLHIANVGDSRAVVVGYAGSKRLTVDHRASDPAETKRITEEGGFVRHGRVGGQLSVSRSLGDHHLKSSGVSCVPSIYSCDLSDEYAVVIASDGLWDALEDDDVRGILSSCIDEALSKGGDQQSIANYLRQHAARSLVDIAKERGSRDNILALVAFF